VSGQRLRLQAALRRYRLVRDLQFAPRQAGRRFENADRAFHPLMASRLAVSSTRSMRSSAPPAFAAMTGSFDKIRIAGRNGLTLAEKWRAGPRAYLGIASVGFPNLFMITGPGSPSVLASMIQAIEQHVDWLADCIGHMRDVGQPPSSLRSMTRTPGSSTSTRYRQSRCGLPAAPGMSAPTYPAGRASSCPISAASPSMCRNATRS